MSSLILMRHGQASFGESRYDALSAHGREQAKATGVWLGERGDRLTALLHGPRARQGDTAKLVAETAGITLPLQMQAALDEFAEGEDVLDAAAILTGQPMHGPAAPPRAAQLRAYDAAMDAWAKGALAIPGRDDFVGFRQRAVAWLWQTVADAAQIRGQRILAVSSAGVIAAVVCEVLKLEATQWRAIVRVIDNGSLTEVVFSGDRIGLRAFNGTGHLPPRLTTAI